MLPGDTSVLLVHSNIDRAWSIVANLGNLGLRRPNKMGRLDHRIFGPPPAATAQRAERLRWVRRFYTRSGLPIVLILIIVEAAFGDAGSVMVVLAACLALELIGLASISFQIRRADQAGPEGGAPAGD